VPVPSYGVNVENYLHWAKTNNIVIFVDMSKQATTSYPKDRINILFLENISDKAVQQFNRNGYVKARKLNGALSEEELIREIKDVHLLGIRSKTHISAKVLAAATKLQAIGCFCIGVNQVDLKAATQAGRGCIQCTIQ
jgi:D-3-phosphoglycerate dehydrogenase